jgi:2-dehydropantoate 2-reductase
VDVVLVAVKTWQVSDAARALGPVLAPSTFVVPLQNGVEAASQLIAALGAERVVGGLCGTLSFIAGPGRIRSIGGTHFVRVGELDRRPSERTERLRAALARAGVTAEVPPDIHVALWEKFLFVVPLGGLGSVARAPIGVLRRMPETRRMLEQGMREIEALARARGIALQGDVIARTMAFVDRLSPDGTTSLSRDIMDGRPSELDAWCGAVVRLGREAGVATPLHDVYYHSLLPLERRARGEKWIP